MNDGRERVVAGRKPNSVSLDSALTGLARDDNHSSSPAITGGIKRPTRVLSLHLPRRSLAAAWRRRSDGPSYVRTPIWPCSVRGLACHRCCHRRGALLPHLFTLACTRGPAEAGRCVRQRCVFCATFLRVAPTGCYPAHCPAEFGLSSRLRPLRGLRRGRPPNTINDRSDSGSLSRRGSRSEQRRTIVWPTTTLVMVNGKCEMVKGLTAATG